MYIISATDGSIAGVVASYINTISCGVIHDTVIHAQESLQSIGNTLEFGMCLHDLQEIELSWVSINDINDMVAPVQVQTVPNTTEHLE